MPRIETTDSFNVGKSTATFVNASVGEPSKVFNAHGGKLFYKTSSGVSTSDTEVATAASVTTEVPIWLISDSEVQVSVEHLTSQTRYDETITEKLAVTGTTTTTGGIVSSGTIPGVYVGGWNPVAATSGTDTTPAEKKLFTGSLFLPANKKIKGIGFLVGSVGGTNKAVAGLFSSTGALLANTSETTEGTTVGTAAEIQEINLTSEYSAVGPALYFIGITMNGNTARLRTITKNTAGSNLFSKEITITEKNKLAAITAPSALEADKAPVAWVF